jgi:hypothetical protein
MSSFKRITFEEIGKTEGLAPEDREAVLNNVVSDWNVFRRLVSTTNEVVEELGKELEAVQAEAIPAVEEKVGRVHASLGTIPFDYDAPATSAWGSIAAIGSEMARQAAAMLRLDGGIQETEKKQTAMARFIRIFEKGVVDRLSALGARVVSLETTHQGGRSTQLAGSSADFEAEVMRELSSGRARVTLLEQQNAALVSRMNHEAIEMGGVIFQSQEDCQTWVTTNLNPADFYDFYDVVSLLEQFSDTATPHSQIMDMDTKSRKLDMTVTAHRVITSFGREVPLVFMKGAGTIDKPLSKLTNHLEWDHGDGSGGLKNEIGRFLDRTCPGAEENIRQRFHGPNNYEARSVALECLRRAQSFILEMNTFISTFYSEMTNTSGGQHDIESWILTCKIIKVVFYELNLVRAVAARASDVTTEEGGRRVALVLWGTLRAHKLMSAYSAAKFRRHPSVAPCLMLHLFTTRTSPAVLKNLQSELASTAKTLKVTQGNADKALLLARTAKQQ